ncbi:Uncharacterized protein family UPF0016 [Cynara cardunculus var. scolymus]|uniref:GDT1 family protein n=1 Tax=Cynara cardunculus var. scolymus TaxID=59895 RepID=A0A103YFA2_CYNCS|nr:Uncharacterized protein family UPF0016 [Cynara cardunculus var. scolymus]
MTGLILHQAPVLVLSNARRKLPLLASVDSSPCFADLPTRTICSSSSPSSLQCRDIFKPDLAGNRVRANASNVGVGAGGYAGRDENDNQNLSTNGPTSDSSSNIKKLPKEIPYPLSIALVLSGCALVFSIIAFGKGAPSSLLAAISKSGFTAAFTLIFVSEIGDKRYWPCNMIKIFNSVPAQFQTTLPIGEYAAVTLLMFFGLKAIKDAWDLPSSNVKNGEKSSSELDEFAEAEELVKEKASKQLKNPFEIIWKSFSLVFFAEWGDRSMLATIALGAAQSPWGVASGAIAGHLLATAIAAVGGAFLASYISEKLVGYLGGVLFLLFAVATFLGVF